MKQEPGAEDGIPKLVRSLGRVSLPTGPLGTVISRLANACRLAPLAAEAGISSSHLRARVNTEIGGPLSHLRLWSRLKTAVACLPDGPTAVTAARAGFADHPHLTRVTPVPGRPGSPVRLACDSITVP
jgi:transcriptional regulator GlxA family with amidase domain